MSRVRKEQSNSDVQVRSEADRETEQVRTQNQRPRNLQSSESPLACCSEPAADS
jgi:hypothetical protein